jgi:hypothetical protein
MGLKRRMTILTIVAVVTSGAFGVAALTPATAHAANPIQGLANLNHQFADNTLAWFLALPDYSQPGALSGTSAAGDAQKTTSNLQTAERYTTAIALALLGLTLTAAAIPASVSFRQTSLGAQSIVRAALAAVMLVAWPFFYHGIVVFGDAMSHALFHGEGSYATAIDQLEQWAALAGGSAFASTIANALHVAWLASILMTIAKAIGIVGVALFLGLIAMKLTLTIGSALVYVAMPLALSALPLPGLDKIASVVGKIFGVLVSWPALWALCLLVFTSFEGDSLSGGLLAQLFNAIASLAMLLVLIALPWSTARVAMSMHPATRGIGGMQSLVHNLLLVRAVTGQRDRKKDDVVRKDFGPYGKKHDDRHRPFDPDGVGPSTTPPGAAPALNEPDPDFDPDGIGSSGGHSADQSGSTVPTDAEQRRLARDYRRQMSDVRHGHAKAHQTKYDVTNPSSLADAIWKLSDEQRDKVLNNYNDETIADLMAKDGQRPELWALGEARLPVVRDAIGEILYDQSGGGTPDGLLTFDAIASDSGNPSNGRASSVVDNAAGSMWAFDPDGYGRAGSPPVGSRDPGDFEGLGANDRFDLLRVGNRYDGKRAHPSLPGVSADDTLAALGDDRAFADASKASDETPKISPPPFAQKDGFSSMYGDSEEEEFD